MTRIKNKNMKIKKGDKVIVITGKDKGKSGPVLKAFPKIDMVLVEGVNKKKLHKRPKKSNEKGKIIEQATPVHVSNVKKVS
jgi:large subunit ribosomal protein L24